MLTSLCARPRKGQIDVIRQPAKTYFVVVVTRVVDQCSPAFLQPGWMDKTDSNKARAGNHQVSLR